MKEGIYLDATVLVDMKEGIYLDATVLVDMKEGFVRKVLTNVKTTNAKTMLHA